jgi:DNA polymerase-3 subunit gamma/tau
MRDALSLTDQVLSLGAGNVTAERVREALGLVHEDEYIALLDVIGEHRAGDVFTAVGRLADFGVDFGLLLAGLADILRAQLAIALGGGVPDLSDHVRAQLIERKARFTSGDLLRMLTMIVEIEPHFRRSAQQQLLLETLIVRFALLDRTVELEDVLRGLGDAPSVGGGGGGTRREAPPAALSARPKGTPLLSDSRRAAMVSEPAPSLADRAPRQAPRQQIDLNRLAERWDDVVEAVRTAGRGMIASALAEATPSAVTASGIVTIGVASDALSEAIGNGSEAILAALRTVFDGVERVAVQMVAGAQAAPRRLTAEDVIADRVAMLRKRDPLLDAAIEGLDLRLID